MSRFDEILDRALEAFRSVSEALLGKLNEYRGPYARAPGPWAQGPRALPDARFSEGLLLLAAGMLAARSPQPSKAAAHAPQDEQDETSLMKRFYRLLKTPRFKHRQRLKLLYADARRVVEVSDKERMVQVGMSEEVYRRPALAARFLGLTNLLDARVVGRGLVETAIGTFQLGVRHASGTELTFSFPASADLPAPGESITLSLDPQALIQLRSAHHQP